MTGDPMRPVHFGPHFGWLHGEDRRGGIAVLLCHPLGNDGLCTHREWRDLACMLAEAGFPALRFDYRDTGDAADLPAATVADWIDDVVAAAAFLRRATGATRVALCGLRLGSALAFLAAERIPDVAGLAMLGPVITGRQWVRELRAAAGASHLAAFEPPPPAGSALTLNANGFAWPRPLLAGIETIDLTTLGTVPACHVLMQSRAPSKPAAQLAKSLQDKGVCVEQQGFPGFESLMWEPLAKSTPVQAFQAVVEWVGKLEPGAGRTATPDPPTALPVPGGTERPLRFGAGDALFGVLCKPDGVSPSDPAAGFAVLSLHTGTSHHIGNGRMLVAMARDLARDGIASLRMDAAGLGDSPAWPHDPGSPLYGRFGVDDVRAALDALAGHGIGRVLVVGVCAGAHMALQAALGDPRVCGAVVVNLQKFDWKEGMSLEVELRRSKRSFRSYLHTLRNPGQLKRLLRGEGDLVGIAWILTRRVMMRAWHQLADLRPPPPGSAAHRLRADIATLAARGCRTWFVWSDEDPGLADLSANFGPNGRRLHDTGAKLVMLPKTDHNLNALGARARFMDLFHGWARQAAGRVP